MHVTSESFPNRTYDRTLTTGDPRPNPLRTHIVNKKTPSNFQVEYLTFPSNSFSVEHLTPVGERRMTTPQRQGEITQMIRCWYGSYRVPDELITVVHRVWRGVGRRRRFCRRWVSVSVETRLRRTERAVAVGLLGLGPRDTERR